MSPRRAALALAGAAALAGCGGETTPTSGSPPVLAVSVPAAGGAAEVATGFASDAGRVVTVAHAVAGRSVVLVASPGGRTYRGRVLRVNQRLDLALLSVPGLKAPTLRRAHAQAGQAARVLVVRGGRARSLRATVRRLITANVREAPDAVARVRPALELEATVMQGDSGAPIVDGGGRVIGTLFAQARDRDDVAYAVAGP